MCSHGDTVDLWVTMPAWLSHTGRERVAKKPIDRCIAPLVAKLNAVGLLTANSCCGHGNGPGSIVFHNGDELEVPGVAGKGGVQMSALHGDRTCDACGLEAPVNEHDPCLGMLPGAMNACCGHGSVDEAYVQFWCGGRISGQRALAFIQEMGRGGS